MSSCSDALLHQDNNAIDAAAGKWRIERAENVWTTRTYGQQPPLAPSSQQTRYTMGETSDNDDLESIVDLSCLFVSSPNGPRIAENCEMLIKQLFHADTSELVSAVDRSYHLKQCLYLLSTDWLSVVRCAPSDMLQPGSSVTQSYSTAVAPLVQAATPRSIDLLQSQYSYEKDLAQSMASELRIVFQQERCFFDLYSKNDDEEIEPLLCSIVLYDITKSGDMVRSSETYRFMMMSKGALQPPIDGRQALFSVPNSPDSNIIALFKIYRPYYFIDFEGESASVDASRITKLYCKPQKTSKSVLAHIKRQQSDIVENMWCPFAYTIFPLSLMMKKQPHSAMFHVDLRELYLLQDEGEFDENNTYYSTWSSDNKLIHSVLVQKERAGLQQIDGHFQFCFQKLSSFAAHLSLHPRQHIYKQNGEIVLDESTGLSAVELQSFQWPKQQRRRMRLQNHCFVYPKGLAIMHHPHSGHIHWQDSPIWNIQIEMQLVESSMVASNALGLHAFFDPIFNSLEDSSLSSLCTSELVAINYSDQKMSVAHFCEEHKFKLPLNLDDDKHFLLFRFYASKGTFRSPLGFSVLPLIDDNKKIVQGDVELPVFSMGTSFSLSRLRQETAKLPEKSRKAFRVTVESFSTLFPRDEHISAFIRYIDTFSSIEEVQVDKSVFEGLAVQGTPAGADSDFASLVVLEHLLDLLLFNEDARHQTFRTLVLYVEKLIAQGDRARALLQHFARNIFRPKGTRPLHIFNCDCVESASFCEIFAEQLAHFLASLGSADTSLRESFLRAALFLLSLLAKSIILYHSHHLPFRSRFYDKFEKFVSQARELLRRSKSAPFAQQVSSLLDDICFDVMDRQYMTHITRKWKEELSKIDFVFVT